MIGLHCARRDQRVGALRQRVGDEKLQLARLVAAARKAGEVVALDEDVGASEMPAKAAELFDRSLPVRVAAARKPGELQGSLPREWAGSRSGWRKLDGARGERHFHSPHFARRRHGIPSPP
jgi:hypothetical protein